MTNSADPFDLTIHRCGPIASGLLQRAATGAVIALFEQCFYVRLGSTCLCVGTCEFADGPVNVITAAPVGTNWRACGLKTGDRAVLAHRSLRLGQLLTLTFDDTNIWQPDPLPVTVHAISSLQKLEQFYAGQPPTEGLAPGVFGALHPPLSQAKQPLEELSAWLSHALRVRPQPVPLPPVGRLLGMGPGLTPSGDDFLGAMMITLHTLQEPDTLAALASAIDEAAPTATHPISAQLLDAASQGLGSGPFHDVLSALREPESPAQTTALRKLAAVGHTSGWDSLAGLYVTLKIWQAVRQPDVIAA